MLLESTTAVLGDKSNVGVYVGVGALTAMSGQSIQNAATPELSVYAGTSMVLSVASG